MVSTLEHRAAPALAPADLFLPPPPPPSHLISPALSLRPLAPCLLAHCSLPSFDTPPTLRPPSFTLATPVSPHARTLAPPRFHLSVSGFEAWADGLTSALLHRHGPRRRHQVVRPLSPPPRLAPRADPPRPPRSEWLTNQHRDTSSSIVGHPALLQYLSIADGEACARMKFELTEVRRLPQLVLSFSLVELLSPPVGWVKLAVTLTLYPLSCSACCSPAARRRPRTTSEPFLRSTSSPLDGPPSFRAVVFPLSLAAVLYRILSLSSDARRELESEGWCRLARKLSARELLSLGSLHDAAVAHALALMKELRTIIASPPERGSEQGRARARRCSTRIRRRADLAALARAPT